MKRKESELAVITAAKDLCGYIMKISPKIPKAYRASFAARMQNMSLEIIENLLKANAMLPEEAKYRIKYYSRYMDDCVIISHDKAKLKYMLEYLSKWLWEALRLKFNAKTQIIPIKNGTDYLGFHIYIGKNGRIIRKVRRRTSRKFAKKLKMLKKDYNAGKITVDEIKQVINSYSAHLSHGSCNALMQKNCPIF